MPTTANDSAAIHLEHIAAMMQLDSGANRFKVKAFAEAASSLRDLGYADKVVTSANVADVPGAGESIRVVLKEFLETGTSERYKDLATRWPAESLSMLVVDGVGPKTCLKFHAEGIHNFDELVAAAQVPGKLKDKVRDAVLFAVKKVRVPHEEAKALAHAVILELREKAFIPIRALTAYEVCGSIRRQTVDSKDVDIVGGVTSKEDASALLDVFSTLGTIIQRGDNRASIRFTHSGRTMQVDLWLVPPESYGSALNYATGSKDHCVAVRALARKRGMLINEYGIFRVNDAGEAGERLGGSDEHDLYRILRLPYVEPEDRTGDLPNSV